MGLVLYNSLTKGEEPFVSLEPKKVKMYTCGPTVWNHPHIGNYRAFLFYDLLRRHLEVSGYRLRHEYRGVDAEKRFELEDLETNESPLCISGQILKGLRKPKDCPAFGKACTPDTPLGATMVSSEGACAAYFAYGRHLETKGAR